MPSNVVMNTVSVDAYSNAIRKLLPVAMRDTGQSGRCAQVLLSAYNGYNFQLSIPDLVSLDEDLYEAAITVIRGRAELRIEPQVFIKDGDSIFEKLHDDWLGLHVENRGKVKCPRCAGRGHIYRNTADDESVPCAYCQETGRVCRCKA